MNRGKNWKKRNGYREAREVFQVICKGKQKKGFTGGMQSHGTSFIVVVFLKMGNVLAYLYAYVIGPIKRKGKLVMQEKMKKKWQGSSPLVDKDGSPG